MKKSIFIALLIIFSCLYFALSYFFISTSANKPQPEIIVNTSPTISSLTWYTSIPQRHADRIANAFRIKKGIDVKIVRSSTFLIREKLLSEIKQNATKADVLTIADIGTFIELKNQGHLMEYASRHYQNFPEKYKDTGYWAVFAGFGVCMAYDKTRIDTPPKHWTDLLDERWKGRIGLEDINTAGSQYGQYYMLREKLGVKFWEKLLSIQKPKIYYRTEALANALLKGKIDIAGQFSIHIVHDYKIKRRTPIKGIYPKEGIPFIVNPVAIIKQTAHVKEAKVFFDFLISIKGQKLIQGLTYKYSVCDGITPLNGIPSLKSLNVLRPENKTKYAEKKSDYIREFNSLFKKGE
ncbi:MAG: extracellular solute-binding protein [Desulfobacula sp.]|uniref:ABC transporter substrate-binding protein n=1 Tax=Desulfobacula sp. TaxID=2593537 RepID=UPI0025BC1A56|nr:extracellular solute-binding protein [Desulfobacula sp.]MCD4718947.1 extracellular solute-binding protein [Desulfobacula sp.]